MSLDFCRYKLGKREVGFDMERKVVEMENVLQTPCALNPAVT